MPTPGGGNKANVPIKGNFQAVVGGSDTCPRRGRLWLRRCRTGGHYGCTGGHYGGTGGHYGCTGYYGCTGGYYGGAGC